VVGAATTAAGAPSQVSTWPVASSTVMGFGRIDGLVPILMKASSATQANPTASAPASESSNHERAASWCALAVSTA